MTDIMDREELRLALKPTKPITLAQALFVGDMIEKSFPRFRIQSHGGKLLSGPPDWKRRAAGELRRALRTTDGMKHGYTEVAPGDKHIGGSPRVASGRLDSRRRMAEEATHSAAIAARKKRKKDIASSLRPKPVTGAVDRKNVVTLTEVRGRVRERASSQAAEADYLSTITEAAESSGRRPPFSLSIRQGASTPAMRMVRREMARRKGKNSTFEAVYNKPPGKTPEEQQAFRMKMFEALLDRPYTDQNGKKWDSLWARLQTKNQMQLRSARDPGIPNDFANDALGQSLRTITERWARGEAPVDILTGNNARRAAQADALRDRLRASGRKLTDSQIEEMVAELGVASEPGSEDAIHGGFAGWLLGTYNANVRHRSLMRRSMGLPGNKTKTEVALGRDSVLDSLDAEGRGPDWLVSQSGRELLNELDPSDEAFVVMMIAAKEDNAYKKKSTKQAVLNAMLRMMPPTINLEVSDPLNRSRARRIDIRPEDAVLSDAIFTIEGGKKKKLPGLTFNETAALIASSFMSSPYRNRQGAIALEYDDAAIAELLGTTQSNVRVWRKRARDKVHSRLDAVGRAQISSERLERATQTRPATTPFDEYQQFREQINGKLDTLFGGIEARSGIGVSVDTIRRFRNGETTLGDVMVQHRTAAAPKDRTAAPTIEIVKPPIVSHLSTPEQRAAGTAFERANARRIAEHNKEVMHESKVRAHKRWVESVETLQSRIAGIESMLAADDMKLVHPSLRQRLKVMQSDLKTLKANPVKRPPSLKKK